ncbi:Gp138 family membrane-puncturing spike protein [Paraburkholderia tropica]|uniref:Gp138 family membrane-puncturing spike protein n=1 Tax=Paraburkholderia tropica TaxID=92647 RepID=UPI002AB63748|nr:Gp138 family membrane-puncturing spike protein [Paraburkholderia tropica]
MSSNQGFVGQQPINAGGSDHNAQTFMVWSILARVRTMTLVKVVNVTNSGGISPVGFADLQPLVNQWDGAGNAEPHGVIYSCPYFRLQGGTNAIIIDPSVGDIGWAGFADRDISSVIANKAQSNPGSRRMFDMADAVYFGGMLNGTPTQYIAFSSSGIAIVSPTQISMAAPSIVLQATQTIGLTAGTEITNSAPAIEMDGQMTQGEGPQGGTASMQGPLTVVNDVVANGTSVHGHTHTAQGATAVTTPPN